jgi:hypothetical protein
MRVLALLMMTQPREAETRGLHRVLYREVDADR